MTRGLHVGFGAPDRAAVDAFWRAGVDAGYGDGGAPGPREIYGPDYYGGFLFDPDGNSLEAVHDSDAHPVPVGRVDHLWLRVGDPQQSQHFYETIAPHAGCASSARAQTECNSAARTTVRDEQAASEHVHLAFAADADATVRAFHAAALAAGYEDHGPPGERVVCHPGYYGAFVLDPDGHTSRSSTTTAEPVRDPSVDPEPPSARQPAARRKNPYGVHKADYRALKGKRCPGVKSRTW